jgi:hypothetical protein
VVAVKWNTCVLYVMCPHATICVLILLCKQVTRAGSQMEYAKALVEYHDDVEADPGSAREGEYERRRGDGKTEGEGS